MQIAQTDTTSVKCLINSISRFIHLVSCQTMKLVPFQKICNNMIGTLKRLKPVLDDIMDYKIASHVYLYKECEKLDMRINEARDFIEKWNPKMSKIHTVLQGGTLLIKLQSTSLDICHMIVTSFESPPSASVLANLQNYIQELQCLKKEMAMLYIEAALRNQKENVEPCKGHLKEIIELLKLTSNQELFKESIAVEKERLNAEVSKMIGDMEEINEIVILVRSLRDYVLNTVCPKVQSGLSIPPYFRCPLSLEVMLDPVIVASGQTFERQYIQKWLDYGLNVCPKTRQRLPHLNLIPNYTVKTMMVTWCEENNVKLSTISEHIKSSCFTFPSDHSLPQDLTRDCCVESLPSSNFISRSSLQTENAFEKEKDDNSFRLCGEYNGCQSGATEKCDQQSPYAHSRSESCSSSISSSDCALAVSKEVSRISNKLQDVTVLSGEITPACLPSPGNEQSGISPCLSGKQFENPGSNVGVLENGNNNNCHSRVDSHPAFNLGSDELNTASHVNKLIEELQSQSIEMQTTAAEELRLLTKNNNENRIIVGQCGAVTPLLLLLYSDVNVTQEHAVTALLNLSINDDNKVLIMEAGAIEPLIHVLKTGNDSAKENSAATLFSLSVIENNKARIGRSGAVKALVDLLASGTLRGKKDAATALFNLSIFHENKARIVQAGAVKFLVQLVEDADGMVDKAVALLSNLSTIHEGRLEIVRAGGIPSLVEIVETGSQRGRENAASIILQLCLHSTKFCTMVLQEGAVPPLVGLSQSGTPRAREKAQQLLSHFRNMREVAAAAGKGKS